MNISAMKHLRGRPARGQGGFTMVELAIVLVIAGIVLVGALKGTDMINKAKIERTVSDIRGIQTMIFEHEKRTGRLAGDCNSDGIIGVTSGTLQVARLAGTVWDDNIDPTLGTGPACLNTTSAETDPNVVWKDLRKANIVDPSRLNRLITKNQTNNYYAVGNWNIGTNNVPANVIVIYDVPLWMAKGIDVAIDGASPGANGGAVGRVRLLHDGATVTPNGAVWPAEATDANDDRVVAIYFQFDRLAP